MWLVLQKMLFLSTNQGFEVNCEMKLSRDSKKNFLDNRDSIALLILHIVSNEKLLTQEVRLKEY